MPGTLQLENYSPASEITVLAVCFVMVILLGVSFKVRMRSFRIFIATLVMLIAATSADLMLHYLIGVNPDIPRPIIYGLRSVYHILLFAMLHHYVAYTCEASFLSRKKRRPSGFSHPRRRKCCRKKYAGGFRPRQGLRFPDLRRRC